MKTPLFLLPALAVLSLSSCTAEKPEASAVGIVNVDAEKAAALIEEKSDLVILDIRTPEEFAEGHLAGAVNIDFNAENFAEEIAKLDSSKPYLMHCRSGRRSGQALPVFEGLNFGKLYHLDVGMNGWVEAGQAVAK